MNATDDARLPIRSLVLGPALITLALTLLRLTGELLGWAPSVFVREGGGGGSLLGIVWLAPVFGAFYGLRLAGRADRPAGLGLLLRAGLPLAAVMGGVVLVARVLHLGILGRIAVFLTLASVAGWPSLGRVLLVYGLAARVPVAVLMLPAILGNWGTHYDAPPPDFPDMSPLARWFLIGLLPQMLLWVPFTLVAGALAAGIALTVTGRAKA